MNDPLMWSILLLVAGLVLIVLELFIPSGGILSILSGVAVLSAIVVSFFDKRPYVPGVILLLSAVGVPAAILAAIKWWPDTPLGRLILIRNPPGSEADEEVDHLHALVGKRGQAKSQMLPGGVVVIEDKTYDAVSDGVPIDAGQAIRVIAIRNNRPVVRPAEGAPPPPPAEQPPAKPSEEEVLSQPFDDFELDSLDDPPA